MHSRPIQTPRRGAKQIPHGYLRALSDGVRRSEAFDVDPAEFEYSEDGAARILRRVPARTTGFALTMPFVMTRTAYNKVTFIPGEVKLVDTVFLAASITDWPAGGVVTLDSAKHLFAIRCEFALAGTSSAFTVEWIETKGATPTWAANTAGATASKYFKIAEVTYDTIGKNMSDEKQYHIGVLNVWA